MVDLRLDQDVSEALASGVGAIADPAERERISTFLTAVNESRSGVSIERLEAVVIMGQDAYESRTPELHFGWQKIVLVETGLAGERLEHHDSLKSFEAMKWSYDHCKTHGYTIDDVDNGTPMGEYMYNINLAIIANMPPPNVSSQAGYTSGTGGAMATSGGGCLIAALCFMAALSIAR
jgi:hypothetical protein